MDEAVNAGLNCFKILDDMYQHDTTQHGYILRKLLVLLSCHLKMGTHFLRLITKQLFVETVFWIGCVAVSVLA